MAVKAAAMAVLEVSEVFVDLDCSYVIPWVISRWGEWVMSRSGQFLVANLTLVEVMAAFASSILIWSCYQEDYIVLDEPDVC